MVVLCGLAMSSCGAHGADGGVADPSAGAPHQTGRRDDVKDEIFDFDIPAQPLASALQRYALATRRPALFSSAMVARRNARAVRGRYTAEVALQKLLENTGLAAQQLNGGTSDAFVLKVMETEEKVAHTPVVNLDYGARVQAQILRALCADSRTEPGDYRALLRFNVDRAGHVRQAQLLTSSGNASRDTDVLRTLEHVRVGGPPPPDMAQPITMILLPRDPRQPGGVGARCTEQRSRVTP